MAPEAELVAAFRDIPVAVVGDCMGRSIGAIGLKPYHARPPPCCAARP